MHKRLPGIPGPGAYRPRASLGSGGDGKMDREHVRGTADKAKGAVKETAGKLSGDKQLEAEGKLDKAKGQAHKVAGDVKDAARKATE
jgi:uncharacterized protein YjbJ (UPF0337 family)